MSGSPIVDGKVSVPPPHRWAPERAAARAKLDRGEGVGVTLVATGPGYLKRELVGSWARADPDRRVAWVSLDEADDPARLLVHTLAAVRAVDPDFGAGFVPDDLVGDGNWEVRAADGAVEALGAMSEPLVLVFDGVHRLVDPLSRRGVETLIRYRPEMLRIIVITRDDAAIDLASARMSGSVTELREQDLELDVEQTLDVLETAGVGATMEEASALRAATEGWPAGIILAATHRATGGGSVRFAPEEEPLQSFLRNRVLASLDDDLEPFFLRVATLGTVHPDLAVHVTGRTDAGRLLDRLTEIHLLFDTERPRPGWRTFPAHLRRFAHHELGARDEAEARNLCRGAALWCSERHLLDESLTMASLGEDVDLLARILLTHHLRWSAGNEADRVRAWSSVLLQADPRRVEAHVVSAWSSLFLGEDTAVSSTLALLESQPLPDDRKVLIDGELAIIRSHLARRRGEMDKSLCWAQRGADAAGRLGEDVSTVYSGALPAGVGLHVAVAALWADDLREAVVRLDEVRSGETLASRVLPVLHSYLALAHWLLDEDAALANAEVALAHVRDRSLGALDATALSMGLILGVGEQGDRALGRVLSLAEAIDEPATHVLATAAEAMQLAPTNPSAALDAVRRARRIADACPEPGVLQRLVAKVAFEVGADGDPVYGEPLTRGEQRVLHMLAGPLTEREIATELHLSHNTVRTYRRRLYRKLGLSSRADVPRAIEGIPPAGDG